MKSIALRDRGRTRRRGAQVTAAVELLDGGATVPFIARYRKEATGALDDTQLRTLDERLRYLRELEDRRSRDPREHRASRASSTTRCAARSCDADSKARLEDIYLPYKPKRRTKAQIAREAGLEPLADALLADPKRDPQRGRRRIRRRGQGRRDAGGRARRRARHPDRALLRGCRAARRAARGVLDARAARRRRCARASRRRARSSPTISTSPSRCTSCPRIASSRCFAARRRRCSISTFEAEPDADGRSPGLFENRIAAQFGVADRGRPADKWLRRHACAAPGATASSSSLVESTCACACGRRPRTRR